MSYAACAFCQGEGKDAGAFQIDTLTSILSRRGDCVAIREQIGIAMMLSHFEY